MALVAASDLRAHRASRWFARTLAAVVIALALMPAGAHAGVVSTACKAVSAIPGPLAAACKDAGTAVKGGLTAVRSAGALVQGNPSGAAQQAISGVVSTAGATAGRAIFTVGFAAVGAWVGAGAQVALRLTASVIDRSTRPALSATWFSGTYWRIAGIAAMLTVPFLFAAAIQALLRSDLALLLRAALGYLPLSLLAVSIAAPVTTLLLAASDGMSTAVASASGGAATRFLTRLGTVSGGLSLVAQSPFVTFLVGLMLVGAAILLWVEMLMREAAIYIVVLMLPLVFAGFVWPARRTWAIRSVELLVALILSKFAVVCVLALGGAALGHAGSSAGGMLVGLVLVLLSVGAPWAVMRLLPMAELAAGAAGHFSAELPGRRQAQMLTDAGIETAADWVSSLPARLERQRDGADEAWRPGEAPAAARSLAAVATNGDGPSGERGTSAADDGASGPRRSEPESTESDVPLPGPAADLPDEPADLPDEPPERPVFDGWSPVLLGAEMAEEGYGGLHPRAAQARDAPGTPDARTGPPRPEPPSGDGPVPPPFHRLDGEL